MEHSKLIRTLSALTESELKAFRKWAFEGNIRKNNELIHFFEYLYSLFPHWEKEKVEKEKIFSILFPSVPYDDRIIRRIMSELLSYIKEYIILYIQNNEIQNDMLIADFYLERKVNTEYSILLKEIEKKQVNIPIKSENHLYLQYQWEYRKIIESSLLQTSHKRGSLKIVIRALDIYYVAAALHWNCLLLNNKTVYITPETSVYLSPIQNIIKNNPSYLEVPVVALYYQVSLLWSELDNVEHYDKLQVWLQANEAFLSFDDQRTVAKCLRNYCIKRMRSGEKDFYEKLYVLMEHHFAKGFFIEIGIIPPIAFNNMITIYLRQKKAKEARVFIETYQQYLKEDNKEAVLGLAWIKIDFAEANYKSVLQRSSIMENVQDLILQIESKRWRAKALFMLEENELLNAHLDAMKMNLHRSKELLLNDRYTSYQLFVKYMRKLVHINLYDKKQVQKLHESISKEEDFVEREWLMEILIK